MSETEKERAYRWDLFVAPDWSERFSQFAAAHVKVPEQGRVLEINCGTGARAVDMAAGLREGEVVGADPSAERIAIARAKALTANADRVHFAEEDPTDLTFGDESFDVVVVDASIEPTDRLGPIASEAVRVACEGAPVALMTTLRGSFDEFFSIYWEALNEVGLADELLNALEDLIYARPTLQQALDTFREAGLVDVKSHRRKEEFRFDSGAAFLASPLVADLFLDEWLAIVPPARLDEVRRAIEATIDRAREGSYFDISAKALLAEGHKGG